MTSMRRPNYLLWVLIVIPLSLALLMNFGNFSTPQYAAICVLLGLVASVLSAVLFYYHTRFTKLIEKYADEAALRPITGADPALSSPAGSPRESAIEPAERIEALLQALVSSIKELKAERKLLLEKTQDIICALDKSGAIARINDASWSVLGYKPAELIGQPFSILAPDQGKGDEQSAYGQLGSILSGQSAGNNLEVEMQRKDTNIVTMLLSTYWSQTEQSFCCIGHDITERKRLEKQLSASERKTRFVMEQLPVAILAIDDSGVIQMANRMAGDLLQREKARLVGEMIDRLIPSFDCRQLPDTEKMPIATYACTDADQHISCDLFYVTIDESGEQLHLLSLIDTSEREKFQRLRNQLVAMVSHDLRAPLTSIKTFTSLLLNSNGDARSSLITKYASSADACVNRLIVMTNNLLDFERSQFGGLELMLKELPAAQLLDSAIHTMQPVLDERKLTVVKDYGSNASIRVDDEKMLQVLVNILSNAIKYSPCGSQITVATAAEDACLQINISDEGPGIPEAELERVFDRFYQVTDQAMRQRGYGLGLSISQTIIAQHQGRIKANNAPNGGAVFSIELPLQDRF